jgi:alpha-tubulin suppressor-like RCC1 family protein
MSLLTKCAIAALAICLLAPAGAAQAATGGTVVAWGCGSFYDYGQCAVPSDLSGVTAIAAGYYHSLAVKSDGTVVAWGCGGGLDYGQCSVPAGLTGIQAVSANLYSMALKSDGTIVAWAAGAPTSDSATSGVSQE